MHFHQSIAILCSLVVTAFAAPGLSAPEIIQRFTAHVRPEIDAIQNTPSQDVSPKSLQSLAVAVLEATRNADAEVKALKGQPIDMVLGITPGSVDVTKFLNDFVIDAKTATNTVKMEIESLKAVVPSGVHAVARPDVTTLTTDLGQVASDIDDFMSDLTQLVSDTSQL